ncbi:MAG: apolipoprotein N-acyltransferase [Desulfatiglandaceae bacterium]
MAETSIYHYKSRLNFTNTILPWLGAALSGMLLTASFPPLPTHWLAWICLVPLLIAIQNRAPAEAFRLGYVAGIVHFITLIYWIVFVLQRYGGLPIPVGIIALCAVSFYLALYIGFFSAISSKFIKLPFSSIFIAAAWVALEYARANLIIGFPWCLAGYTQYQRLSIIQISDLGGVYWVSFLVVLVNVAVFQLFSSTSARLSFKTFLNIAFAVSALVFASFYGSLTMKENAGTPQHFKAAVIQPNIDQGLKWDEAYRADTVEIYMSLTEKAVEYSPDLVVWPETATPFYFQENMEFEDMLFSFLTENKISLIFGSPAYEKSQKGVKFFNRAYLLSPEQKKDFYDKVYLVPFGEYVPFKSILFFVNRLVPAAGDFTSGTDISPLGDIRPRPGAMICFEVIFPAHARRQALAGADFFVNLTNDAWFGRSSAPHQHLAMSVFRSIEQRKPMIRAANTGISACIDRFGKIRERTDLFTRELMLCTVNAADSPPTFYARYGDLPTLTFNAAVLLLGLFFSRRPKSRP